MNSPKTLSVVFLASISILSIDAFAQASDTYEQATYAPYVKLSQDAEIRLARSAAPPEVSRDATIWILRNGTYEVAIEGRSQNACFVSRSMPESLEPVCFDPEGARTILPWEIRFMELRLQGASDEERERVLAQEVGSGDLLMPSRAAMSYMMSSSQHLFNPESGRDAGNWKPHIMLYMPGTTTESIGLSTDTSSFMVARPGTPTSYLIVVVPDFVDPSTD